MVKQHINVIQYYKDNTLTTHVTFYKPETVALDNDGIIEAVKKIETEHPKYTVETAPSYSGITITIKRRTNLNEETDLDHESLLARRNRIDEVIHSECSILSEALGKKFPNLAKQLKAYEQSETGKSRGK